MHVAACGGAIERPMDSARLAGQIAPAPLGLSEAHGAWAARRKTEAKRTLRVRRRDTTR